MKINLILAAGKSDPIRKQDPFMPLALPILASCAPEHEYVFTDLLWDDFSTIDYDADYDLVGISFRVSAKDAAFEIADTFRAHNKPVILGGPQASSVPLTAKEHADAVVIGEGELLWPILLEDFKNKSLKDFYIASDRKDLDFSSFKTYYLSGLPDISNLPVPLRQLVKRKYTFNMVFATRGCPVNCHFCAVSKLFGSKMRFKDIPAVVAEINSFGNMFFLIDDTVLGRNDSYAYYKELYKSIAKLPKKRFWTGQANLNAAVHPDGKEVIKLASESGLTYAAIGFETINWQDMQKMTVTAKMGVSDSINLIQQLNDNIAFIQNYGIAISAWFTIGLETDTVDTVKETIAFCMKNHLFPMLTPIQALEGTRFHEEMKRADKLLDQKTNVSNVSISAITNEGFIEILKYNLEEAFSLKNIMRNSLFYFKKNRSLKRGTYDLIFRTIFIIVTQFKLKGFLKKDIIRFKSRFI